MDKIFASIPQKRQQTSVSSDQSNNQVKAVFDQASSSSQPLPKGVVLDKDGKPCRTCTSSAAWMAMMKQSTKTDGSSSRGQNTSIPVPAHQAEISIPYEACPPDVEEIGRSTWTLLHSLPTTYPDRPSDSMKSNVRQFLNLFSNLYPCWVCAADFREWMKDHQPRLDSQDEFGQWMCEAHNDVNRKLGKDEFDCSLWKQRWKDGWKDGRCD